MFDSFTDGNCFGFTVRVPLLERDSLPTVRGTDRPTDRPVHRQRYLADGGGGDPKTAVLVSHSVARVVLKIHGGVLETTLSVCEWHATVGARAGQG